MIWEMPPELLRDAPAMVPGWRWQGGGGQGWLHSSGESHPALLWWQGHSWMLLGHAGGINCSKASLRVSALVEAGHI